MNPFKKNILSDFSERIQICPSIPAIPKSRDHQQSESRSRRAEKKKCKNVLIITDAGIHKLGLTDCLEKSVDRQQHSLYPL